MTIFLQIVRPGQQFMILIHFNDGKKEKRSDDFTRTMINET
jgi:hypothetical protein